jgi:hypothetical protein
MTKLLSAALISIAMIATPAIARTAHVPARYHAQDADAGASPVAHQVHDRVGIPAPPDGESCDVGDNPRIC